MEGSLGARLFTVMLKDWAWSVLQWRDLITTLCSAVNERPTRPWSGLHYAQLRTTSCSAVNDCRVKRRTPAPGALPRQTSPISSFHRSGRASMNPVIMSTHRWSSTTTTSTALARSSSSAPRKVRFSPITTLGIP